MQDELESIFHVLIYYAVRFVDSNIDPKYVDQFVYDYFDARLQYLDGDRCGLLKKSSIKAGFIDVSGYNDARSGELEFYRPPPSAPITITESAPATTTGSVPATATAIQLLPLMRPVHSRPSTPQPPLPSPPSSVFGSPLTELDSDDLVAPDDSHATLPSSPVHPDPPTDAHVPPNRTPHTLLNNIVSTLLGWFKAYYALDKPVKENPSAPAQSQDDAGSSVPAIAKGKKLAWRGGGVDDSAGEANRVLTATSVDDSAEKQREEDEATSKKLQNHRAMHMLLFSSLNQSWPRKDCSKDKMSIVDGLALQTKPRQSSNKRALTNGVQPASKRAKTSTRT